MFELLKALIYGIIEGISEWLPISSTGHMILVEEILPMDVSAEFWNVFLVVVQLGAIMAVVLLYWNQIFPFKIRKRNNRTQLVINDSIIRLWLKIIVACIPAAIVGLLFDEILEKYLYNAIVVSLMLVIVGIAFIFIENQNKNKKARVKDLNKLTFKDAIIIGAFQLIAAIFPGTSRSGATILGGLMIGVSRSVASEFTFFLAIPVMFGASLLKLLKYILEFGFAFSALEIGIILVGVVSAFVVSIVVIKFLMGYIKKHDFKVFGYYRIVLGIIVLLSFVVKGLF